MTCIVGYVDKNDGSVWIGADSFGSTSFAGQVYSNKKVFHLEGYENSLAGYTSSFRMGQLLQYSNGLFDELSVMKDEIDEKYMVTQFIPSLKKLFKDGEFGDKELGGTFLIGVKDKLYKVQDDFSILETKHGYDACGSGEDHALGSLHTTKEMDIPIQKKVEMALASAEYNQVNVRRPFYIMNTKTKEVIEVD